jgi:hypothetical protein
MADPSRSTAAGLPTTGTRPRHKLTGTNWQIGQAPTPLAETANSTRERGPGKSWQAHQLFVESKTARAVPG